MKTKSPTNPADQPGLPKHERSAANGHHPSTTRLSDQAFYLIVLAKLLQRSVEPEALKQFLVPGSFTGYGNAPAQ